MRRLLLILLACLAFVPVLPMPARASHRAVPACAACPMQRGHDAGCAGHGCFGCSTEAEPATMLAPRLVPRATTAVVADVAAPTPHRPGFDPPPPRANG